MIASNVKSGAPLHIVKDALSHTVNSLNDTNNLVVFAGSNDFCCESDYYNDIICDKFMTELESLVAMSTHTNLLIVGLPIRYDLKSSCFEYIEYLNVKIRNLSLKFSHCKFIDVASLKREDFTRHGFHLNRSGKVKLANEIASKIKYNINNLNY